MCTATSGSDPQVVVHDHYTGDTEVCQLLEGGIGGTDRSMLKSSLAGLGLEEDLLSACNNPFGTVGHGLPNMGICPTQV